jgi:hypothetical protein
MSVAIVSPEMNLSRAEFNPNASTLKCEQPRNFRKPSRPAFTANEIFMMKPSERVYHQHRLNEPDRSRHYSKAFCYPSP